MVEVVENYPSLILQKQYVEWKNLVFQLLTLDKPLSN